jgi:hypothetical protein
MNRLDIAPRTSRTGAKRRKEIAMATRHAVGASVTPVTDAARGLVAVVIRSRDGRRLHLDPPEACALQEQIGQLRSICQGPRCAELCGDLPTALTRRAIGPSGVAAWPMCRRDGDRLVGLGGIWIESRTGDQPPLTLTPEEMPAVARALTHIVLDYLHDASWGGEDARDQ